MAITFISTRGFVNLATPGSASVDIPLTTGASIAVGNTLIVGMAYREVATPPTDERPYPGPTQIATDLRGNLWRRVGVAVNQGTTTAANDGAVAAIWMCHVTFPYQNGDLLTLYAPIVAAPLAYLTANTFEYSGVLRTGAALQSVSATGNGTSLSVPGIQPINAGQLVFATSAVATNVAVTGDSDTTDGAWTAANSGNGGTEIHRTIQTKIVTGTAAQTWDNTWAGTQQWAATAVVLEEASNTWPLNDAHLANPGYPCPAGAEIIPITRTNTPVDTGTAYIFDVTIPPESADVSSVYWSSTLYPLDPAVDSQHSVVAEVYPRGDELIYTKPSVLDFGAPNYAVLQGGAVTEPGGGTTPADAIAALADPGDTYVVLEPGQTVDCYWDFSALVPYVGIYRVLNLRLSYVAWKDDSADANPGEGLYCRWRDETAVTYNASSRVTSLHGAWLVNDYQTQAKWAYKNLGEINGLPQLGGANGVQYADISACFTVADLIRMNTGTRQTMLTIGGLGGSFPSQTTVFLDAIKLEVVICPEKRIAQAARRINTNVGFPLGDFCVPGPLTLPMYSAATSAQFWTTPEGTDNQDISVVMREGVPASPSDWFAAQSDPDNIVSQFNSNIRYASQERVGPSMALRSIVQPRETLLPQLDVSRVEWSDGQVAPGAVPEEYNELIQTFSLIDLDSLQGFWPQYQFTTYLDFWVSSAGSLTTKIGVSGANSYDYLKIVVKAPDSDNSDLNISIQKPLATEIATVTLTAAQVRALPDISGGYREVVVPLSTTITPTAGSVFVVMSSDAPETDPWVPAGAYDNSGRFSYSADPQAPDTDPDFAIVLCCPLPDLAAEILDAVVEIPSTGTSCTAVESVIPCITVDNATDYDWISISRLVDGVDELPLALIDVYGELTYPVLAAQDSFNRVVVGGWGSADIGGPWTLDTPASFSVNGSAGVITSAANTSRGGTLAEEYTDVELTVRVDVPATPTGGVLQAAARVRADPLSPDSTGYFGVAQFLTDGRVLFAIAKGTATTVFSLTAFTDYIPGTGIYLKIGVSGETVKMKRWLATQSEPAEWDAMVNDTSYPDAGVVALQYTRASANTSPDPSIYWDDFSVMNYDAQLLTYCDYGVPWDLPSSSIEYVITGWRDADRRTTTEALVWTGTSPSAGAAFGLAVEDALYAYVPGAENGELQVTWNPLYPVEMMPLAGKDYQVALRPSERRGLSITTNLLIQNFARCGVADGDSGIYDESLAYDSDGAYDYSEGGSFVQGQGRYSLAPTPFNDIRSMERQNRMTLKLPGGHTRYVYVDVGALVITPVRGIHMAEVTLTDTTLPAINPWEAT